MDTVNMNGLHGLILSCASDSPVTDGATQIHFDWLPQRYTQDGTNSKPRTFTEQLTRR